MTRLILSRPMHALSLALLLVAAPAVATAATVTGSASDESIATATPDSAFGTPIPDQVLAKNRGGHELIINDQYLSAQVYNNGSYNNTTGANMVTDHAFSGTRGIPTLIQNSGNNVIVQNATILNVTIK